jgi:hypothetical protein
MTTPNQISYKLITEDTYKQDLSSHRGAAEDSGLLGCYSMTDILKDHSTFIFMVKQFNVKAQLPFKLHVSVSIHQLSQNIPKDLNIQTTAVVINGLQLVYYGCHYM